MTVAPKHPEEEKRIEALQLLDILDTPAEEDYDKLVSLASILCDTPIALISLIDKERQWFKSKVGLDAEETHRDLAFCAHCILSDEILEVQDATKDERFYDNPLVTGDPNIRFYAGSPLYSPDGLPLGTLCVIDDKPRKLSKFQEDVLKTISDQISSQMELRLAHKNLKLSHAELGEAHSSLQELFKIIAHDLRSPFNGLLGLTGMLEEDYDSFTTEDVKACLSTLHDSASETYILLENLLEWSNLQTGSLSLNPKTAYAAVVADNAVRILSTSLTQKEITLTNNIPKDVLIQVDTNMIECVIRNLTSNATKFTPFGGTIDLSSEVIDGSLKITITDNGTGMLPEQMEAILLKKKKLSVLGTNGERGSGIGLNLIHNFLSLHESELEVASELNKGSALSFRVPLA